jgi:hypothetical protein
MIGIGTDTDNLLRRVVGEVGVEYTTIPEEALARIRALAEECVDAGRDPNPAGPQKDELLAALKAQIRGLSA